MLFTATTASYKNNKASFLLDFQVKIHMSSPRPDIVDKKANDPKKVVIPDNNCVTWDIITRLKNILSDLKYDVYTCCCCSWIDNADYYPHKCFRCEQEICRQCYETFGQSSDIVYCYMCSERHDD
jgi:hypothetical protein